MRPASACNADQTRFVTYPQDPAASAMTTGFLPARRATCTTISTAAGDVAAPATISASLFNGGRRPPVPSHEPAGPCTPVFGAPALASGVHSQHGGGRQVRLEVSEQRRQGLGPPPVADDGQVRVGAGGGGIVAEPEAFERFEPFVAADAARIGCGEQAEPATVHFHPCGFEAVAVPAEDGVVAGDCDDLRDAGAGRAGSRHDDRLGGILRRSHHASRC